MQIYKIVIFYCRWTAMYDKYEYVILWFTNLIYKTFFSLISETQVYYHNKKYAGLRESVTESTSCKSSLGYSVFMGYVFTLPMLYYFTFILTFNY